MKNNVGKVKTGSVLIIIMLVCASLTVLFPLISNLESASAASTWLQTSDKDFDNGTKENVVIRGKGEGANLQIDLSGIQTWTQKTTVTSPISGLYHSTASVWNDDKVVCYGGYWYSGGYYYNNETWIYDYSANKWIRKFPASCPTARYYHAMATIWGTDKVILYGGYYPYTGAHSDTWIYDVSDNTWININPTNNPGARYYHAMAAIDGTDNVMLYGGYYGTTYSDTWIYDFSMNKWTQKNSTGNPYYRYYHSLSTIFGTDKILLFGGYYYAYDQTWVYDLSDDKWTRMYPNTRPCYRWYHAMAPVWGTDNIVLFGGYGYYHYYTPLNDTWVYDYSDNTWTMLNAKEKPNAAYYHAMATIYNTDRILLFGGYSPTYGYWGESWIYRHNLPTRNGTYISRAYDAGENSTFYEIDWYDDKPANTSIRFQLRTSKSYELLNDQNFVGPDGKESTYYTSGPTEIWSGHDGDRWVQYKVFLNISVFTNSPRVKDVTITYNCLPKTIVIGPVSGSLLTINKPTFAWTFEDPDSEKQQSFQVIIANDTGFKNIHYDSGEQKSSEQSWEFPTGTSYTELADGKWFWRVRTKDEDDCWTKYSKPWILNIDTLSPSSAPTEPINDGYYNSLNTLYGIGIDGDFGSGIKQMEIAIKRLSDNYYWTGTKWVPLTTWLFAEGGAEWTYDSNSIEWTSGDRYLIQSRATDEASNIEMPSAGNIFTMDMDSPISNVNYPINNIWLNKLNSITGTSYDISGSGVDNVEISIKCTKDANLWDGEEKINYYWSGKAWRSNEVWLSAKGADEWTYNTSQVTWSTGNQYFIRCRAIDKSGNLEVSTDGNSFMYDPDPPEELSVYINNGDEYTGSYEIVLSLQAEDFGSGVSQMAFSTDNEDWTKWQKFNTTKEIKLPPGDGKKTVYYRVKDYAGNVAEPVTDTIYLDTTPPKDLSIRINDNDQYTNSIMVRLELNGKDIGSGIKDTSLSFDGINWLPWDPYRNLRQFSIPTGDGEKVLYFKLRDNAGNIAEPVFDTIILDTSPPHSLMILVNNGATATNSTSVTLNINAIDETSKLTQISFSSDGEVWSDWENYTLFKYYELESGEGNKIIYFKVKDSADNEADPVSATIKLTAPTTPKKEIGREITSSSSIAEFWILLLIIIIIILLLVIMALVLKRKKRSEFETPPAALTIKPGGMFSPPTSLDQVPAAIKLEQLPATTSGAGAVVVSQSQQLGTTLTPTAPALAKSTLIAQSPGKVTELPALPPARLEEPQTEPEVEVPPVVSEPEPVIVTTPIPTTQPQTQPQAQPVAAEPPTSPTPAVTAAATLTPSPSPKPSTEPTPSPLTSSPPSTLPTLGPEVHLPDSTAQIQPQTPQPSPQAEAPPQVSPPQPPVQPPSPSITEPAPASASTSISTTTTTTTPQPQPQVQPQAQAQPQPQPQVQPQPQPQMQPQPQPQVQPQPQPQPQVQPQPQPQAQPQPQPQPQPQVQPQPQAQPQPQPQAQPQQPQPQPTTQSPEPQNEEQKKVKIKDIL